MRSMATVPSASVISAMAGSVERVVLHADLTMFAGFDSGARQGANRAARGLTVLHSWGADCALG
jgi:hypothetical protein